MQCVPMKVLRAWAVAIGALTSTNALALESYRCVADEVVGFARAGEFEWAPVTFEVGAEYVIVEVAPEPGVMAPEEPDGDRPVVVYAHFALFAGGSEILQCSRRMSSPRDPTISCSGPGDEFEIDAARLVYVRTFVEGFVAYDEAQPPRMETGRCVKESQ